MAMAWLGSGWASIGVVGIVVACATPAVFGEPEAVEAREVVLPFDADLAVMNDKGTLLAVLDLADGSPRRTRGNEGADEIAVVDVETGEVVFRRTLDFYAKIAVMDGDRLFIADREADAIHLVPMEGEARTLFTVGRVSKLRVVAGRVFIVTQFGRAVFDASTLERLEEFGAADGDERGYSSGMPVGVEGNWRIDGVIHAPDLSATTLLEPGAFELIELPGSGPLGSKSDQREGFGINMFTQEEPEQRWGTAIVNGQIVGTSGRAVFHDPRAANGTLLTRHPAAVFVAMPEHRSRERANTLGLKIVDLASGKARRVEVASPANVGEEATRDVRGFMSGASREIFETASGIVVVRGTRAALLSDEQLGLGDAAEPLYFVPVQEKLVAKGTSPVELSYEVRGGTPPIAYSLVSKADFLHVDPATGTVRVEVAKLPAALDTMLEPWAAMAGQFPANAFGGADKQPNMPDWRDVARTPIARVAKKTGVGIEGFPVGVRIEVRARDANQQEAVLSHVLVVDLAASAFDEVVARFERAVEAQRPPVAPAGSPDLAEENRRLKDEIERLKGQVELLKQMLEDKGK